MGVAPAYHTRIREGIAICPDLHTFNNAYHLLQLPSLTFKTWGTAFQILNRLSGQTTKLFNPSKGLTPQLWTLWLSGIHEKFTVLMHIIFRVNMEQAWGCPNTTPKLKSCRACAQRGAGGNHYNPLNSPHLQWWQAYQQHFNTPNTGNQEDIIYRQMNLPFSAQEVTIPAHPAAHLDSTIWRIAFLSAIHWTG